jgi:hypothetical protein
VEAAFEVKASPLRGSAAPAAGPDEREDGLCCGLTRAPDVRLQLHSAISSQRWQLYAEGRARSQNQGAQVSVPAMPHTG